MDNSLIFRQTAIDVLNVGAELLKRVLDDADIVGVERAKYEWGLDLIESYITDMKELPSAQPERKTGRWIDTEPNYKSGFGNNAHYCSVCKGYYTTSPNEMHYCPNCGAKMVEKQLLT